MVTVHLETFDEGGELAKARRVVAALMAEPPETCVAVVGALAGVCPEAARRALLERVGKGPVGERRVEVLIEAFLVVGVEPVAAELLRVAMDGERPLRARGVAFEVWAQRGDALALMRSRLGFGSVEETSDLLIAFLAGALVRAGAPESASRLALLLCMTGPSPRMVELLEEVRAAVGARALPAYGTLLGLASLAWAHPRLVDAIWKDLGPSEAGGLAQWRSRASENVRRPRPVPLKARQRSGERRHLATAA